MLRRLFVAVLVAIAAVLVGAAPASADCWYCTVSIDDNARSEYRSSAHDLGWLRFTVRLGFVPSTDVVVGYQTANGSATAGDYTGKTDTVTVQQGQTTASIYITVAQDAWVESNEWFRVKLTSTSSGHVDNGDQHHDAYGTGWILDDDPARLSIVDAKPANEYANLDFTVRLSAPLTSAVTVKASTAPAAGTASAGADYYPTTKWLTFAPGETTKTFTLDVFHDQSIHEPTENLRITLSSASGAPIADSQAWGTIYEVDFIS
ncbi:Calx-beta domain-containing protein [Tenggerimyces flavus]|uniref:Calx-beta domain-containing protein n=1 Tax=Tenggerimyces flavus TaxID=1708749 RepID=A0ABV7YFI3_9ACTN|nr:Calx-beta domain-containing protein [Tenggerimyces flavus]MBM7786902.1 hypothetical protein [Tenggerimyces flavus]